MSFSYPSRRDRPALSNASLFFPAGETTFVIGRSGSGKSTISNLILQFYDTTSGELTIDGEIIGSLNTSWLRNNITLVQQKSVLFNESIFKNIVLGHRNYEEIRKDEVVECIRFASFESTIAKLPLGLDTLVGIGGSSMSGGQRQRLAISRARLRDTPILILDEVTNALDHTNMTIIMENLREWRKNKTTIIITHDVSQVRKNDFVYVMDKGRVIQEGYRSSLETVGGSPFFGFLYPNVDLAARWTEGHSRDQDEVSNASFPGFHEAPLSDSVETNNGLQAYPLHPPKPPPKAFHNMLSIPTQRQSENLATSLGSANAHLSRLSSANMSIHPFLTCSAQKEEPTASLGISPIEPRSDPFTNAIPLTRQASTRFSDNISVISSLHESSHESNLGDFDRPTEDRQNSQGGNHSRFYARSTDRRLRPFKEILGTVWPNVSWRKRVALIVGSFIALVHAAATPLFSWVFSRLLGTFFGPINSRSSMALIWSIAVLGIAASDAIASYFMHFLLEVAGQEWVDALRTTAFQRIIDQPQSWFDMEKDNVQGFCESLDRDAEETRNLVGRFGGFVLAAIFMMGVAFFWCIVVCWRLTLVGVACAPVVYGITRSFETLGGRWERISNDASNNAANIFAETFGNIRTVRALTLEGYFHRKYAKATRAALKIGVHKALTSGSCFGVTDASLIFVIGMSLFYS